MRGDKLWVGLALGLVAPAIGFLIYCLLITQLIRREMTLSYFMFDMVMGLRRNLAPALSLSLFADVGLFFLLDRRDMHRAMRGVIGAMLFYGVLIVIAIILWGRELLS
jgi:hypothetical protein